MSQWSHSFLQVFEHDFMTECPLLKNLFGCFILFKQIIFVCMVMGVKKNNNKKNVTVLYVGVFGDGR